MSEHRSEERARSEAHNRDERVREEPLAVTAHLRIVSGDPTPEELAVITALVAASRGGDKAAPKPASRWGRPVPGRALRAGPDAWVNSRR
jgi:hypothetical protein